MPPPPAARQRAASASPVVQGVLNLLARRRVQEGNVTTGMLRVAPCISEFSHAFMDAHQLLVSARHPKLTQAERRFAICVFLAGRIRSSSSEERKLQRGAIKGAADAFDVSISCVERIWRRHKSGIILPEKNKLDVRRKKGSGRKFKLDVNDVKARVRAVPFSLRKSPRSLSPQVGIPHMTLYRYLKLGVLAKSRSAVKPTLTPANKVARVEYCRRFVEADGCFGSMLDRIDIDEKWWYLTEKSCSYIVVPGEELPPNRFVQHKSHIIKVMCLCASARPRQNHETGEWWDGKIGMWFFAEKVPAQRTSKNRPAGTIETKSITINTINFVKMVIDDLLPAIEEKWPAWAPKKVSV